MIVRRWQTHLQSRKWQFSHATCDCHPCAYMDKSLSYKTPSSTTFCMLPMPLRALSLRRLCSSPAEISPTTLLLKRNAPNGVKNEVSLALSSSKGICQYPWRESGVVKFRDQGEMAATASRGLRVGYAGLFTYLLRPDKSTVIHGPVDPFFFLARRREDGAMWMIHRSEPSLRYLVLPYLSVGPQLTDCIIAARARGLGHPGRSIVQEASLSVLFWGTFFKKKSCQVWLWTTVLFFF